MCEESFCLFNRTTRGALSLPLLRLAAASFGRKSEATKLYFIFLLLSCITDFIWMIIYGNQVTLICLTPCTHVTEALALHAHGWCTRMWCPVKRALHGAQ